MEDKDLQDNQAFTQTFRPLHSKFKIHDTVSYLTTAPPEQPKAVRLFAQGRASQSQTRNLLEGEVPRRSRRSVQSGGCGSGDV